MAKRDKILPIVTIILLNSFSIAQDNYVNINQGIVAGLKIFPEKSKTPVYAFLGIPYAQPPIGNLRFSPPIPHYGWNQTYHAKSFKPICPQLTNSIYDETTDRLLRQLPQMDEDCLYINIWSPEIGLRYGNLPVLVIITGEEMSFDWPKNRPSGLDLATEDIIVVTIQYRMNIFGWLTTLTMTDKQKSSSSTKIFKKTNNEKTEYTNIYDDDNYDNELIGNYGLRDQKLAFIWIKDNIHKFGGNPEQITLLGHGYNGGTIYGLIHLLNMKKNENLFSKLILMSGNSRYLNSLKRTLIEGEFKYRGRNNQNNYDDGDEDNDNYRDTDVNYFDENDDYLMIDDDDKQSPSEQIIMKLGCQFSNTQQISNCLRSKSIGDLQKSFESIYKNGNYTSILGPILDYKYLNNRQRFFHKNPFHTLINGKFHKLPILCGICTNEGAFIRDYWIDLAREGIHTLKNYINYTIIPLILKKYSFYENSNHNDRNNDHQRNQLSQIYKAVQWRYFEQDSKDSVYILGSLQRLLSEADYEAPFYSTIELIARSVSQQKFSFTKIRNGSGNNSSRSLEQLPGNFYVYAFHLMNSMDMRGKINLFGGASHSSDLPLLMGPSLFQQISRRRLTVLEYKLCKRLKQYFSDFIKTGNPTPGNLYDEWLPYSTERKFIKILGDSPNFLKSDTMLQFEQNLPAIEDMLEKSAGSGYTMMNNKDYINPYYSRNGDGGGKESMIGDSRRNKSLSSSSSYFINRQDYEYFQYLKIVYSFWNILLPSIYKTRDNKPKIDNSSIERAGREFNFYETADSIKYKHAFFSMLALVCFLLGILGICLYILRKNYPNFGTNL